MEATAQTARPCGCLGTGRHRNTCPTLNTTTATTTPIAAPVAQTNTTIPDDQLEQYGGDLAALESWSPRSRRPFASWDSYGPRGSVLPDLSPRGMLVYKHDPGQKFHFAYLEEDGSPHSRMTYMVMRRNGYVPVTADDFIVHPSLRDFLQPDDTGHLSLGALKGAVTHVYAQPEVAYRRSQAIKLQHSDNIQKTAEERASEIQSGANRDGLNSLTASATMEDDHEAATEYNR